MQRRQSVCAGKLRSIAVGGDHVLNTPSLSDDERIAILGETAAKLLRI